MYANNCTADCYGLKTGFRDNFRLTIPSHLLILDVINFYWCEFIAVFLYDLPFLRTTLICTYFVASRVPKAKGRSRMSLPTAVCGKVSLVERKKEGEVIKRGKRIVHIRE